jgi:hypothetical protein
LHCVLVWCFLFLEFYLKFNKVGLD